MRFRCTLVSSVKRPSEIIHWKVLKLPHNVHSRRTFITNFYGPYKFTLLFILPYPTIWCWFVVLIVQDVRDDVGQKQGVDAANALLRVLETKIKSEPYTFTQILDILGGFALSPELITQMREQCEARKVATTTQRPSVQSTDHWTREATVTQGLQCYPLIMRQG